MPTWRTWSRSMPTRRLTRIAPSRRRNCAARRSCWTTGLWSVRRHLRPRQQSARIAITAGSTAATPTRPCTLVLRPTPSIVAPWSDAPCASSQRRPSQSQVSTSEKPARNLNITKPCLFSLRTASYSHTAHQLGLGAGPAGTAQQAILSQRSNLQVAEPQGSVSILTNLVCMPFVCSSLCRLSIDFRRPAITKTRWLRPGPLRMKNSSV